MGNASEFYMFEQNDRWICPWWYKLREEWTGKGKSVWC